MSKVLVYDRIALSVGGQVLLLVSLGRDDHKVVWRGRHGCREQMWLVPFIGKQTNPPLHAEDWWLERIDHFFGGEEHPSVWKTSKTEFAAAEFRKWMHDAVVRPRNLDHFLFSNRLYVEYETASGLRRKIFPKQERDLVDIIRELDGKTEYKISMENRYRAKGWR